MTDKLGQKQAERDLARHEATHPGCNERYWMTRCEQTEQRMVILEQAATHFFHCRACGQGGEPCEEGLGYARALGLIGGKG